MRSAVDIHIENTFAVSVYHCLLPVLRGYSCLPHLNFKMVWETRKAPEDWQKAVIVAIHKKGARSARIMEGSVCSVFQAKSLRRFWMPEYIRRQTVRR